MTHDDISEICAKRLLTEIEALGQFHHGFERLQNPMLGIQQSGERDLVNDQHDAGARTTRATPVLGGSKSEPPNGATVASLPGAIVTDSLLGGGMVLMAAGICALGEIDDASDVGRKAENTAAYPKQVGLNVWPRHCPDSDRLQTMLLTIGANRWIFSGSLS